MLNVLLIFCFIPNEQNNLLFDKGCACTVNSFLKVNRVDHVYIITPSEIKLNIKEEERVHYDVIGHGPYNYRGFNFSFFTSGYKYNYKYPPEGKFTGNALRHFFYLNFLLRKSSFFDRLIVCDAKDVVFIQDPFLREPKSDFVSFSAEPPTSGMKRFFIKKTKDLDHCYSKDQLLRVRENRRNAFINGGFIYGRREPIMSFVRMVFEESIRCNFFQADQHYINIVYSMYPLIGDIYDFADFVLQAKTVRDIKFINGALYHEHKELNSVFVIHQYNWHSELKRQVWEFCS